MILKILSILDKILTLLEMLRVSVEKRRATTAARKVADEIDRAVAATPVDALTERMRKYQRD